MLSKIVKISRAELKFREAFERLKSDKPDILPKGSQLSQNNVAREAGVDPSALRRSRFPCLVSEIQEWCELHKSHVSNCSAKQTVQAQRAKNRTLQEKVKGLKAERDKALGLLLDAQSYILELTLENQRLQAMLPKNNVHMISKN
ncbi:MULTISPECIES: hypothetical protein [unclassified Providencia]|uniref:hypothetical protein n=1 Tax=unclassified Providencia TaxID=2633465 RepID=UPI00234A446E|nr:MULTISPECIES: hypothetical protein [unclassified Providencia]HEP0304285.1 hypothetical protein [Providencia rettgeri]